MPKLDSPKLKIGFEDRIGFVFDVSKVILQRRLNIVSIEIKAGFLFMQIEKIDRRELPALVDQLRQIPGVLSVDEISTMPSEEKEKKIRAVLDAVSEGILAVDMNGVITNVNPVAEKIFQRPAAELVGKNLAEETPSYAPLLRCLKSGKPYNYYEMSFDTPKGRLNFLMTVRPLKGDRNNIIGAVASIKDMSDVKQLVYNMTKPAMTTFEDILGTSPAFKAALDLARRVSREDTTVLIRGESGTGKELFARAIHMGSPRFGHPFVPVNCAALPDNLLESELFGYVQGAFSGAQKGGKVGLFEFANNGTLFLDEIGELSTHLQAKLLRVLQDGRVRRLGDTVEYKVNVRVIVATNRNLEEMITKGDFREDLYYRLNVVPVHIPPLRQRQEDIPLFTRHLIAKFSSRMNKKNVNISNKAMAKLMGYSWPGNVRELENVLERAMILAQGTEIQPEHIIFDNYSEQPPESGTPPAPPDGESRTLKKAAEEFEKAFIRQALKEHASIRQTARALGVSHTTIMNKIKKYGLNLAK